MCLAASHKDVKIAEKNITCYKILELSSGFYTGRIYTTPYMGALVPTHIIKGKKELYASRGTCWKDKGVQQISGRTKYMYRIDGGYIHTYAKLSAANNRKESLLKLYSKHKYYIFKCVIPKGAEYYEGLEPNGYKSYASECIKFVDRIN